MIKVAPGLDSTPLSLIEVLAIDRRSLDWERFVFIYYSLFQRWLSRYAINSSDMADVIQEVLLVVLNKLPEFQHNGRTGAFRAWLKMILHNQVCNYLRQNSRANFLADFKDTILIDPNADLDRIWDSEHDQEVLRRLLLLTKPMVPASTWEAFTRTAVLGESSQVVAEELGMTLNAVYIARSRVMSHLRRLARGLIDLKDIPAI